MRSEILKKVLNETTQEQSEFVKQIGQRTVMKYNNLFIRSERQPDGNFVHTLFKKVVVLKLFKLEVEIVSSHDFNEVLTLSEMICGHKLKPQSDNVICNHTPVRIESTVPYMQCSKCFKNLGSAYQPKPATP